MVIDDWRKCLTVGQSETPQLANTDPTVLCYLGRDYEHPLFKITQT